MKLSHFAWGLLLATFTQLVLGSVVHSTGSSLACPDWPLCYGQAFPDMEGGIFYEHSHRMVGTLVGLLTIVVGLGLALRDPKANPVHAYGAFGLVFVQGVFLGLGISQKLGWAMTVGWIMVPLCLLAAFIPWRRGATDAALGLLLFEMVIVQGLLGGLTVIMLLPTAVSTAHLGLAMLFLGGVIYALYRVLHETPTGAAWHPRKFVLVALGVLFVQMILGALVRHTGASLACGVDILTCNGSLAPQGGAAHLHFTHRVMAIVTTIVLIAATLKPLKAAREQGHKFARFLAIASHGLVVVQVMLGVLTVMTAIQLGWASAHLAVAALLFAVQVAFYISLGPLGATPLRRNTEASAPAPMAEAAS